LIGMNTWIVGVLRSGQALFIKKRIKQHFVLKAFSSYGHPKSNCRALFST